MSNTREMIQCDYCKEWFEKIKSTYSIYSSDPIGWINLYRTANGKKDSVSYGLCSLRCLLHVIQDWD